MYVSKFGFYEEVKKKPLCFEILNVLRNLQRNQYFKMRISSLLIVIAPSVLCALVVASKSTQENHDWDELQRIRKAWALKKIDKLCRGEILLPANIQKQLKCRYTDNGDPFLKIAPFREEEAYLKPRIVIFHGAIYNEEIEILKKLAQPSIKLDEVETDEEEIQLGRIGQMAWLYNHQHEILSTLDRRVEHMTKLSATSADPLQVFHYRIGGMYLPHLDFLPPDSPELLENGNRIATLMYYLNDVEEGGRTVFTKLNVSLTPKKGSAVFWYNLKPNGMGDPLTLHAGCPVIAGTKWVANVWLNEKGQEFLRPCTLENEPEVDRKNAYIFG